MISRGSHKEFVCRHVCSSLTAWPAGYHRAGRAFSICATRSGVGPLNKQLKNVGNLGDILKHGALVRLAKLMRTKAIKAPLLYFDTQSEEHTSELQSRPHLVCRLLLEKKNKHNSI